MTESAAQPAAEATEPAKPTKKRARSTARDQEDALRVLGVLKVATATQIQALVRPHLADNKPIRNALLDLALRDEAESEGSTAGPSGRFGAPDRSRTSRPACRRIRCPPPRAAAGDAARRPGP